MLTATVAAAIGIAVPAGVLSQQAATSAAVTSPAASSAAGGLGQLSGLLPRNKLTLESAIQVNLSNEPVRLPLYPGEAGGKRVWYVRLDASDAGAAHDLSVNYAPKLANIAISDPAAVQTVTLGSPTPAQNPFGPAVVKFAGAPDFSPTRIAVPGPTGFPLAKFQPGAVAGPGYSPFIRIVGSTTVYNAPIVATGNGPFDVTRQTNTAHRVLGVHIAGKPKPGQFAESWADLLFVKGFDAGQPIVYLSTDAGQRLTAVLERSTYVPALIGGLGHRMSLCRSASTLCLSSPVALRGPFGPAHRSVNRLIFPVRSTGGHLMHAGGGVPEPVGDLGGGHVPGEAGAARATCHGAGSRCSTKARRCTRARRRRRRARPRLLAAPSPAAAGSARAGSWLRRHRRKSSRPGSAPPPGCWSAARRKRSGSAARSAR